MKYIRTTAIILKHQGKEIADKDAQLIIQAVNACKSINLIYPINAANTIPELFKALEQICKTRNIAAIYNIAKDAIKKATSK